MSSLQVIKIKGPAVIVIFFLNFEKSSLVKKSPSRRILHQVIFGRSQPLKVMVLSQKLGMKKTNYRQRKRNSKQFILQLIRVGPDTFLAGYWISGRSRNIQVENKHFVKTFFGTIPYHALGSQITSCLYFWILKKIREEPLCFLVYFMLVYVKFEPQGQDRAQRGQSRPQGLEIYYYGVSFRQIEISY